MCLVYVFVLLPQYEVDSGKRKPVTHYVDSMQTGQKLNDCSV
jgi:hypothetical protein